MTMADFSTKDGDELLARAVLRAALGAQVEVHDDGSAASMYDLDVYYPDGQHAAAEVVSTRDRVAMSLAVAAQRRGHTRRGDLTRRWIVRVEDGVILRDVAKPAVALLQQLEQQGIDRLSRMTGGPLCQQAKALQIQSCLSFAPTSQHPPGYYLSPATKGSWASDSDDAVRELDRFLPTVPDVPAKLLASGLPQRHAVVIVTVDLFDFFCALDTGELPRLAPTLPAGVDCVWLVPLRSLPIVSFYWLGDGEGWRKVMLEQRQVDELVAAEEAALGSI